MNCVTKPMVVQEPDGSWRITLPAPEDAPGVWHAELQEGDGGALIIAATWEAERAAPLTA